MTATELRNQTRDVRRIDRRRVLAEARARLAAINQDLEDAGIDAGDLERDAEELGEVADRIQSLALGSATLGRSARPGLGSQSATGCRMTLACASR
jgi:hypothetical protein